VIKSIEAYNYKLCQIRNMARSRHVVYNTDMRVTIRHKDIEMTDSLREHIERKIVEPVGKRLKREVASDAPILDIEAARISHHHHKGMVFCVSASLTIGTKLIRAEAVNAEIYAACDRLKDELLREIVGYKTKPQSLLKRGARMAKQYLRLNPAAWLRRGTREREEGR